jgi:hypothetical protein
MIEWKAKNDDFRVAAIEFDKNLYLFWLFVFVCLN